MSTKIYDGLRIDQIPGRTIFTVAREIREALHDALRKQSVEDNARAMRALLIRNTQDTSSQQKSQPNGTFVDYMTHLFINQKDDDAFDLSFMLFEVPGKDYWLGDPIGRHSWLASKVVDVKEIEGVREWGYWNNTDQPEDVTDEEWDVRRQDWDVVGFGPVVDYGLSIRISDYHLHPVNYVPRYTSEEREELARQVFTDREKLAQRATVEALFAGVLKALPKDHDLSPFRVYMDINDAAKELLERDSSVVSVPEYDIEAILRGQEFDTVKAVISDDVITKVIEDISN